MSRELEGFLYFGVMGIVLVAVITFAIVRMKKTKNFGKALIQSIGFSFLLFFLECIWWLFQADGDGLSQLFGWLSYGIVFVISCLLNAGILFFIKKKINL